MSNGPKPSVEMHTLCGKLRDQSITESESDRLCDLLLDSKEARRYYRAFMVLTSALESRQMLQDVLDQETNAEQDVETLLQLLEMEQSAPMAEYPAFESTAPLQERESLGNQVGWRQVSNASSYLFAHAMRSSATKWVAAAAVVLFAVTLYFVFGTGSASNTPASITDGGADHSPSTPSVVATLTAEHDAVWDRRPGQDLFAGQRLKLISGFAEITTNRGAVAILEGPATFEMLENENALRLQTGKLVGICLIDASKGFVVRTPHMDITDLGTRFGVDATRREQTTVKVFDGEVQAELTHPTGDLSTRQSLAAGDAVAAHTDNGWVPARYEPNGFVKDMGLLRYRPDFHSTNAAWLGVLSGDLRQGKRKADALQVFLERRGHVLAGDISVDFNREHPWEPLAENKQYSLEKDEQVDVYLLHFDLLGGHEQPDVITIDFGRPVLGVIVSENGLNQTDASLGLPDVKYPKFPDPNSDVRGLNFRASDSTLDPAKIELTNDFASLSSDGTQLKLRLWGGRGESFAMMDQVRVLVQSKEDTP